MLGFAKSRRLFCCSSWRTFSSKPNIAIAGVTGAVGRELLDLIESRNFQFNNLKFLASSRSSGKKETFLGETFTIEEMSHDSFKDIDIAFFSCGGSNSLKFAPHAANEHGTIVIDNSSAFRMDPQIPLIVPEINGYDLLSNNANVINNNNNKG